MSIKHRMALHLLHELFQQVSVNGIQYLDMVIYTLLQAQMASIPSLSLSSEKILLFQFSLMNQCYQLIIMKSSNGTWPIDRYCYCYLSISTV